MSARNWSRLDEDTGVLIRSIELVKIPLTFYQASLSSQFHRFKSFNGAGKRSLVCDALLCLLCDDDLLLAPLGSENSWAGCVAEPKRSFENSPLRLTHSLTLICLPAVRLVFWIRGGNWNRRATTLYFCHCLLKQLLFSHVHIYSNIW